LKVSDFIKENSIFLIFLLIISLLRIGFLSHFKYIDFEDANIAIMAKDILEGKNFPLYAYGVPYNAGEVVDAFILAMFFKLFGLSNITIKSLALIENIVLVIAFYIVLHNLFTKKSAILGTVLFSFSPSIMVWNFYLRGYLMDTIFYFFVFYSFWKTLTNFNYKNIAIWGVISGFTFWMKEFIIIQLLIAWIFIIFKNIENTSVLFRKAFLFILFFIAGYLPSIIYNLTHDFLNWKNLLSFSGGLYYTFLKHYQTGTLLSRFILHPFLSTVLFSEPYNDLDINISLLGIIHWFMNIIIFFAIIFFIINKKEIIERKHLILFSFILIYMFTSFIFLDISFAEPYGYIGTRFYVLLYPLWIVLIIGGIQYIHNNNNAIHKFAIGFLLLIILLISLLQHINVLRQDFLIKEYEYIYPKTPEEITNYPVKVRAKSITNIIEFLKDNSINKVFTVMYCFLRPLSPGRPLS